jgi:hypothetical protein
MRPRRLAVLVGACALGASANAAAQLRWDVGGEVGVVQRIKADRPRGAAAQLPGPVAEVHGDLALLPMVRIGAHVAFDVAPLDGIPPERTLEGGVQLKFAPPLLAAPWRTWVEAGLGYGWAYEPGYRSPPALPAVAGASGGVFDVPVGVALGYRAGRGLEPFVELGARFGVGFVGPLYAPPAACDCSSPFLGRDVVALSLSLGLNSNQ